MQALEPKQRQPNERQFKLVALVVALLILAISSIAILAFVLHRTTLDKATLEIQVRNSEVEKGKAELDRQNIEQKTKLAIARAHQAEALVGVRAVTNACGQLLQSLKVLEDEVSVLRTNKEGQLVARQLDLLEAAKRFYERDLRALPQRVLILSKLEGARELERQLVGADGTTFEPSADFIGSIQADMTWADQEALRISRARVDIVGLIVAAQHRLPPQGWDGKFVALGTAIAGYDAALRQRWIDAKAREPKLIVETRSNAVK